MHAKTLFSSFFFLMLLLSLAGSSYGQQGGSVKEPYSVSLQASRSALGIEVTATIRSVDPLKYPLPTSIKQFVADPVDGPKYHVEKFTSKNVSLTNGQARFLLRGYDNCQDFHAKVHIQVDGWHDEHLEHVFHVLSKPNLLIERIDAPERVSSNSPFTVQATIREINGDTGATTTVTLYEGSSTLASVANVSVTKGGSTKVTFPAISSAAIGKHYYTVKISDTNPAEFDITNNSRTFTVDVVAKPDLRVERISVPDKVYVNTDFEVYAYIREAGGSTTTTATVSLFDGSTLVGTASRVEVRGGSLERVTFRGITPTTPGQHVYTVTISNANPAESNASNNSSTVTIPVLLKPDLSVVSASAPTPLFVNQSFDITAVIRELSGQSGASAFVSLYEGKDVQGAPRKVTLAPGGTAQVLFQGINEKTTGAHTYTVKLSNVEPCESNEANNGYTFSVPVVLRPDLKVDKVTLPQSVTAKVPFVVDALIKEIDGQSGVSATVTLSEGTTSLGSVLNVAVPASGSATVSFPGIVASSQGNHNYTVKITNATPVESDVSNNSYSFSLSALAKPDLAIASITAPSSVSAGAPFSITATVKELLGIAGATAKVTLYNGSNETIGTTQTVTVAAGASKNVTFTGIAALASATYTVRISGSIPAESNTSNNDKSVSVTVTAGAASLSQSIVTISPTAVALGSTATITLQAKDAAGNNLTTGGLAVAFTAMGGGSIGSVADNHNGTYSATFTPTTAGIITINATIGGSALTSAPASITVTPGAVSLSQSIIGSSSATVQVGSTSTITLQVRDAAGNNVTIGVDAVAFTASGGGSFGPVTDNGNGNYSAIFTATTVGNFPIGATIGGSPVTSAPPMITVTPGAVSLSQSIIGSSSATVQVGSTSTITLQARDAAGNNVTIGVGAVAFTANGGGSFGPVTDNGNGNYSAIFTATTVGNFPIGATIGGSPVTSASPMITVTPGAISLSQSIVTISPSIVAFGSTATITLQAKDAAGNNLTTGGLAVEFTATGGGSIGSVTDNHDGTYSATFTATTAGTTTISATLGGSPVRSTLPTISVVAPVTMSQNLVSLLYQDLKDWTRVWGSFQSMNFTYREHGDFHFTAEAASVLLPESPIDRISWTIGTPDGVFDQASFTPVRTGGGPTVDVYTASGMHKNISYTLTVDRSEGSIRFTIDQQNDYLLRVAWGEVPRYIQEGDSTGVLKPGTSVSFSLVIRSGSASWTSTSSYPLPPLTENAFPPVVTMTGSVEDGSAYWTEIGSVTHVSSYPVIVVQTRTLPVEEALSEDGFTGSMSPATFSLGQNYPNPFNPSTTFEFALPKSAFVTLKVYDMLAREVATVVSHEYAAGVHKVRWDASAHPSGMYICRVRAGDFVAQKKLVLVR